MTNLIYGLLSRGEGNSSIIFIDKIIFYRGAIIIKKSLDRETTPRFNFRVKVTDGVHVSIYISY